MGREVSSEVLLDHLGNPPTVAKSSSNLAELELKYEVVKLYLWLSMRYPEAFVDRGVAESLEEAIEEGIEESLELGSTLPVSGGVRPRARRGRSRKTKRKCRL